MSWDLTLGGEEIADAGGGEFEDYVHGVGAEAADVGVMRQLSCVCAYCQMRLFWMAGSPSRTSVP